jgi:hypothetical protein
MAIDRVIHGDQWYRGFRWVCWIGSTHPPSPTCTIRAWTFRGAYRRAQTVWNSEVVGVETLHAARKRMPRHPGNVEVVYPAP